MCVSVGYKSVYELYTHVYIRYMQLHEVYGQERKVCAHVCDLFACVCL